MLALALAAGAAALSHASASESRPRPLGAVVAPVTLLPNTADPIAVDGLHRYFGSMRIGAASDGLVVVNRLRLERYLLGLQEVPANWPVEALRAQAVAARTYALWTLARPRAGSAAVYGFDICASVQCQVFAGADVYLGLDGARWAQAVADTKRLAILYSGEPILARYHSTSGGQTLANSQAFPHEGVDYPYLQPVPSTVEEASPLYRWRTAFRLAALQELAERAGFWDPASGRVRAARTVPSATGLHYPDVVLEGRRLRVRMTAEELRIALRTLAPQVYPALYPAAWHTTSGRLPETLPSNRIEIATRGGRAIVVGRGWGHGVGMSQWGAYGLAARGASYTEILSHYYTGVTIGPVPDPGPLDVGVSWGRDEVSVSGSFRIVDGRGETIVRRALGTWSLSWNGTGAVAIDPPRGYGLPLKIGILDAPETVAVGEPAFLTVALSRPARVQPITVPAPRERYPSTIREAGRRKVPWFAPLEPGTYRVHVRARAGGVTRSSDPVRVVVSEASYVQPEARERERSSGGVPWRLLVYVAVPLLAALGLVLAGRIRS